MLFRSLDSCASGGFWGKDVSVTSTTGGVTVDDNIIDGVLTATGNTPAAQIAANNRIRRGVVRLSTGAWFDPEDVGSNRPLEKHGNPNALTLDIGASKLSQGCIAQTCLVEIERFDGPAPAVTAHQLPVIVGR